MRVRVILVLLAGIGTGVAVMALVGGGGHRAQAARADGMMQTITPYQLSSVGVQLGQTTTTPTISASQADLIGQRLFETLGPEPTWTKRRAQAELRARLVEVERDHYQRPDRTTFAQFAKDWMETAVPARGLKHSTTENYQSTLRRHLLPAFGRLTLEDLEADPRLIDRYIAQKLRSRLSPKTVTNHLVLLQVMLKQAVRWRLIRHNLLPDTTRPRVPQPHINILTTDEITQLRWSGPSHLVHGFRRWVAK